MKKDKIIKSVLKDRIQGDSFAFPRWSNADLAHILKNRGIKVTDHNVEEFKNYLFKMDKSFIIHEMFEIMYEIADILKGDDYFEE